MNLVRTPQTRCRAAAARCEITPPVGIYHRMWGAAMHEQATGVHRPLTATLLWLEPQTPAHGEPEIIVGLDHCIIDLPEMTLIREGVAAAVNLKPTQVQVTLSHTHGSAWVSQNRSHFPGGELIAPYVAELIQKLKSLASEAQKRVAPATIVYGSGRCNLAAHRDFLDVERGHFVCGYNPAGTADDTVTVARITSEQGAALATIVNYACHPTTLAWDNTLLSPDWVGAMREVVEREEGSSCFFIQGSSGDLGPKEGFVGDTAIADRNGRQVGYAALSALAALPQPGTQFRYAGPVISGTAIGTWKHEPLPEEIRTAQTAWQWEDLVVELPYRHDLPTIEQTEKEQAYWREEEAEARKVGNEGRTRDCRAQVEQRNRQLNRLRTLTPGRVYPLTVRLGFVGDAIWIFTPGELYQTFQVTLRERFAPRPLIVATISNDWQPGYLPTASAYGYNIYQEVISAMSAGNLELLIETISRRVREVQG